MKLFTTFRCACTLKIVIIRTSAATIRATEHLEEKHKKKFERVPFFRWQKKMDAAMRIAIGLCSLKCRAHEIEWRLARRIMISFWLYSHSPVAQSTNIMPLFVGSFFFVFCSYSSALANTEFNLNKSQQERKMEWRKEIIIIESLFYDPINLKTRMQIALTRAQLRRN